MARQKKTDKQIWGWREKVTLLLPKPFENTTQIQAKVDTGAKTSTLHAVKIEPFKRKNRKWIRVTTQLLQKSKKEFSFEIPLKSTIEVTDSGGHTETRYMAVIKVQVGNLVFKTPVTFTNRSKMSYRMLLGRTAIRGRALVDCKSIHVTQKKNK